MSQQSVFISYAPGDVDRHWMRAFAKTLQTGGISVWSDEIGVETEEAVLNAAERAMRKSDVIVSVITRDNARQPRVFFDLGAAIGTGKRFVPLLSRNVDAKSLPEPLRTRPYLRQASPEATARELLTKPTAKKIPRRKRA